MTFAAFVKITVLINDKAPEGSPLIAEHGFSVLVETDDLRLLFDAGQSGNVLANAENLGINLEQLDAIAISHGHFDHIGGLPDILRHFAKPIPVWIGEGAFRHTISTRSGPQGKSIGAPFGPEVVASLGGRLTELAQPHWLSDSVLLTGPIPRPLPVESASNFTFTIDKDGRRVPDDTPEDQALAIKTEHGLVVISGCGHAGVANTLRYARELTGVVPVKAFVGGTHFMVLPERQLTAAIRDLARLNVDHWAVGHCTGDEAEKTFLREMSDRAVALRVGTHLAYS